MRVAGWQASGSEGLFLMARSSAETATGLILPGIVWRREQDDEDNEGPRWPCLGGLHTLVACHTSVASGKGHAHNSQTLRRQKPKLRVSVSFSLMRAVANFRGINSN